MTEKERACLAEETADTETHGSQDLSLLAADEVVGTVEKECGF